jgi:N-acetylmuramoyl-L-alanine amidase
MTIYTVVKGDTLSKIAARYNLGSNAIERIAKANDIKNVNLIFVGQKIDLGSLINDNTGLTGNIDSFEQKKSSVAKSVIEQNTLTEPPVNVPNLSASSNKKVVMLDIGHGGKDSGACYGGVRETDINNAVARRVSKQLKAAGYDVVIIGGDSSTIADRRQKKDDVNPDLYLAIHCNASSVNSGVSGVETYFCSNKNNKKWFDSIKNRQDSTTQLYNRLINDEARLVKAEYSEDKRIQDGLSKNNRIFANLIQESVTNTSGAKSRGVQENNFGVIMENSLISGKAVESALIELGYISNPKERKKLQTREYQNQLAAGIVSGIDKYFQTNLLSHNTTDTRGPQNHVFFASS